MVKDAEEQRHRLAQLGAVRAYAQQVDVTTARSRSAAHVIVHALVDERDLGRFAVVAVQIEVDRRQAGGRAAPHRTPQVGPKLGQALHPLQRQPAQRQQLDGLGVGAEQGQVLAHLVFDLFIGGQRGLPYTVAAQCTQGLAFGAGIFHALFDHQARGGGGDFVGEGSIHGPHCRKQRPGDRAGVGCNRPQGRATAPMRAATLAAREAR